MLGLSAAPPNSLHGVLVGQLGWTPRVSGTVRSGEKGPNLIDFGRFRFIFLHFKARRHLKRQVPAPLCAWRCGRAGEEPERRRAGHRGSPQEATRPAFPMKNGPFRASFDMKNGETVVKSLSWTRFHSLFHGWVMSFKCKGLGRNGAAGVVH